jgi:hypothetical protein
VAWRETELSRIVREAKSMLKYTIILLAISICCLLGSAFIFAATLDLENSLNKTTIEKRMINGEPWFFVLADNEILYASPNASAAMDYALYYARGGR